MSNLPPYRGPENDADLDHGSHGLPRAAKIALIVLVVLILATVIVLHLSGGGFRGVH